ncbi:MAG: hypothetical protein IPK50_10825 [Fibrobacterota bacterium]|nr:hypothetical protein [Fibrobacterota bacterium]QQS07370.1 MAG: hypothetical protein IPK50_10825 [Fibrobacterota bacterium]
MSDVKTLFVASALAGVLSGCGGDSPVSMGGGATETDNVVRLQVGNSDGRALPRAQVVFVRTDTWLRDVANGDGPTTFDALADSNGRLQVSLPPGEWSAQAQTQASGGIIALDRDTSTKSLVLRTLSTLTLQLSGSPVASLRATGTAWEGTTDSAGKWTFRIPPGAQSVVARTGSEIASAASVRLIEGKSKDTLATIRPRRLVLDDFASGDGRTSLASYTGVGSWFSNGWGSRIFSPDDSTGPTYRGKLSMRYTAPDTANAALVGIVFRDRQGFRSMDFSRLDSICFEIRGNGSVQMFFIEYDQKGVWTRSTDAQVPVDSTWRTRCIVPSTMHDPWDLVKTKANAIAFLAKQGDFLEARNLILWGAGLQDFSR